MPPPRPLVAPVSNVLPYKLSAWGTLTGFIIIVPPIASPPYWRADAPLTTLTLPALFISILGACSTPHS